VATFEGVLRLLRPQGPLAHFVDSLWLYRGEAPAHATDLRLPTGEAELVVNLGSGRAVVAGPATRAHLLATTEQRDTLGVVFKVGGASALLGLPLEEIRDLTVPLPDLGERTAEAAPGSQLATIQGQLSARLARIPDPPHPASAVAAARLAAAPEQIRIAELGDDLGLSMRRLQQIFRADVGMSPKAYQRLQRFRSTLTRMDDAVETGWAAFALDRGYYDQSHFIGEFRAHAGLTPSEYFARRGPFVNHVPVSLSSKR
jgi:AraC-like DNA-binding protein